MDNVEMMEIFIRALSKEVDDLLSDITKFEIKMLARLGIIYIGRKSWNDAKTVFLHILKESSLHSFAWRYLGLALTNLEEYEAAEEALNEAILLDIENPLTWAYLTMFCIKVKIKSTKNTEFLLDNIIYEYEFKNINGYLIGTFYCLELFDMFDYDFKQNKKKYNHNINY